VSMRVDRVDGRAEVEELGHMRDHFKKQFRSDFRVSPHS